MEWVETTGRTVDAALDAALDQLGVDEEDVEFEVLAEPKAGLFGRFGGQEARIRARVRPISREKPGEARRRSRRPPGRREQPRERRERAGGGGTTSDEAPASEARSERRPRRQRGRGGSRRHEPKEAAAVDEEQHSEVPVEEQAATTVEFVRGLVDAFGVDATVTSSIDEEDGILVEVQGPDLGLLVGPRGATLNAVEELARTVVQRRTTGHGARLHVDVAGYRAKRREALERFTRELAAKVLGAGTTQVLDPMPPQDRKVVHDVVNEIDGVVTESEGVEPRRRVVIRRG